MWEFRKAGAIACGHSKVRKAGRRCAADRDTCNWQVNSVATRDHKPIGNHFKSHLLCDYCDDDAAFGRLCGVPPPCDEERATKWPKMVRGRSKICRRCRRECRSEARQLPWNCPAKPGQFFSSFSDPQELERVRENFLRKKLGLTDRGRAHFRSRLGEGADVGRPDQESGNGLLFARALFREARHFRRSGRNVCGIAWWGQPARAGAATLAGLGSRRCGSQCFGARISAGHAASFRAGA